jgi:5-(carboxyamino)imidazole ribonucleotide synthase
MSVRNSSDPILPGATIGVLGGGQLGRMFAMAARRLGYRVHTLAPDDDTPTGQVSDKEVVAPYDDLDAVRAFARDVDVVTFEFENVATTAATAAEAFAFVRPNAQALHITQHRFREKTFLATQGLPVAPFAPVRSDEELAKAVSGVGTPAVLKTACFGYDGKGQASISDLTSAQTAWKSFNRQDAILEKFVNLDREVSVIGVRGVNGEWSSFGPIENAHAHHILDVSVSPAGLSERLTKEAIQITRHVMDTLQYIGILCIEFFVTRDGRLLVNELAPRPHNSGHLTIEACRTSQFEQQLRAICGLPLGSPDHIQPAAMANLLGDLWQSGEPNWAGALAFPSVKLHLYGKSEARRGRKMGHLTALAPTKDEAVETVVRARGALIRR